MNAKHRRAHDKLAALPGVRAVRRPVRPDQDGADDQFDLYYVRAGRKSPHPLVVIPGGPGAASVALYRGFRRRAAAEGLDVIMVEHRGVGMSRHDDRGADLPPEALTIDQVVDDVAAVLDDAGGRQGGRLRHVLRHLSGRRVRRTPPGQGARDGARLTRAVRAGHRCGPRGDPSACSGTATTPRPPIWRRRCDGSSATTCCRRGHPAGDGLIRLRRAHAAAAPAGPASGRQGLAVVRHGPRHPTACWSARRRTGTSPTWWVASRYRELNYGATPDGKPFDPAVAYREVAHRHNRIRSRTVRSGQPTCRTSPGLLW